MQPVTLSSLELIPLVPGVAYVALLWRIGGHRIGAEPGVRGRLMTFLRPTHKILTQDEYDAEGQRLLPLLWVLTYLAGASVILYGILRMRVGWG
jgi:hypothetical protein